MDRWLLVGLGNPGGEYAGTRHNMGYRVLEELARRWGVSLSRRQFQAELGTGSVAGTPAVLMKPRTYMNLSGRAVAPAAGFYQIPLERLVVIHDDIDLPLGRLRVKAGGGHGGHNGLRSLTEALGSGGFLRLRIGVGRPERGDVTGHVLGRFSPEEAACQEGWVSLAADAVEEILRNGVSSAMNRYNGPPTEDPTEGKADRAQEG
jgi:PTH1 family peptidyl-tRNA hydrolase